MDINELQKALFDELRYVDDTAQIVLKGHLVAEDLMNKGLRAFLLHEEHLDKARLGFAQKIELCRGISLSDNQNNMWNLLQKINKVRNVLSHSLDPERRQTVIQSLKSIYDQEFDRSTRIYEGMSEESALCVSAIGGAVGFLHSFVTEVERFEMLVKEMDKSLNKGALSSD